MYTLVENLYKIYLLIHCKKYALKQAELKNRRVALPVPIIVLYLF